MRRRLDLAASLVGDPKAIFLDEPTAGLDPRSRQAMWDAVRDLVQAGLGVVLTTQYLEEADQLAGRVMLLDDGRIVAEGTATELRRPPTSCPASWCYARPTTQLHVAKAARERADRIRSCAT